MSFRGYWKATSIQRAAGAGKVDEIVQARYRARSGVPGTDEVSVQILQKHKASQRRWEENYEGSLGNIDTRECFQKGVTLNKLW